MKILLYGLWLIWFETWTECSCLVFIPFFLTSLLLACLFGVVSGQGVQLRVSAAASSSNVFFSDFYDDGGSPVFVLPQSVTFGSSLGVASVQMSLEPSSDPNVQGLSFSTLGLDHFDTIIALSISVYLYLSPSFLRFFQF